MRIVIVASLLGLALTGCAPQGSPAAYFDYYEGTASARSGYYEDPQIAAARINSSTALIGLGTSMMFGQPAYRPRLQQTCTNNWGTVMCYGW